MQSPPHTHTRGLSKGCGDAVPTAAGARPLGTALGSALAGPASAAAAAAAAAAAGGGSPLGTALVVVRDPNPPFAPPPPPRSRPRICPSVRWCRAPFRRWTGAGVRATERRCGSCTGAAEGQARGTGVPPTAVPPTPPPPPGGCRSAGQSAGPEPRNASAAPPFPFLRGRPCYRPFWWQVTVDVDGSLTWPDGDRVQTHGGWPSVGRRLAVGWPSVGHRLSASMRRRPGLTVPDPPRPPADRASPCMSSGGPDPDRVLERADESGGDR